MTTGVRKMGKLQLWEYGRRKLGYGEYLPDRDGIYQRWAGMEAHKLHLSMRKRKATADDFILCVDFCHAMRMRIENPVWVFRHLAEARDWQRENAAPSDLAARVDEAIAHERTLADDYSGDWITRLTRARGPFREEVLSEWAQARSHSLLTST